jgi:hypothetical protein
VVIWPLVTFLLLVAVRVQLIVALCFCVDGVEADVEAPTDNTDSTNMAAAPIVTRLTFPISLSPCPTNQRWSIK